MSTKCESTCSAYGFSCDSVCYQELNNRLQASAASLASENKEKEAELVQLRSQLAALTKQVSSDSSDRQVHADRINSLTDDIKSLTDTKDWYQQQLHSAQETRSSLQSELTRLQNLVSSQADALERVKVENTQLRHQLADTQHRALADKQLLMRHLEAIEADMLEREAGFEELEQEKGLSEFTWQQKMMQVFIFTVCGAQTYQRIPSHNIIRLFFRLRRRECLSVRWSLTALIWRKNYKNPNMTCRPKQQSYNCSRVNRKS